MSRQCDVILVFVSEIEKAAVYNAFIEKYSHEPRVSVGEMLTYHDFGEIGGAKVLGLQIEMGSTTPGGSAAAIISALIEKAPDYVILVGIAFGMDREKQKIGDILVSNKLVQYEQERIAGSKNGVEVVIPRGDIAAVPGGILGRFRALSGSNYWQGAPVHFGLMISGEKLVDNREFKRKLKETFPKAIGGEMEAAGAYAAARQYKRDWIVVKAVCDYADGYKKRNKQKDQKLAAANAAAFVFHTLEKGHFGKTGAGKRAEEKPSAIRPDSVLSISIKKLGLNNFRGFKEKEITFSNRFNLLLGNNGSGKTAVLDALGLILSSVFIGFDEAANGFLIKDEDVHQVVNIFDGEVRPEAKYASSIDAEGIVMGKPVQWSKSRTGKSRPTVEDHQELTDITAAFLHQVRQGEPVTLPVIAYYGTGRLWLQREEKEVEPITPVSRWFGYNDCLDPRSNEKKLLSWMKEQELTQIQRKTTSKLYEAVKKAITDCIEEFKDVWFDFRSNSIMVRLDGDDCLPAHLFSDGYRNMIAMVADIAYRMAILNPHLGRDVALRTPGVLLIDEIDLHLHPIWQRSVVEDLKRTFPCVQFVVTSHSPFIVQSLKFPEELIVLDHREQIHRQLDMSIEDIAEEIMNVHLPQKSKRYIQMMKTAELYYKILEEGKSTKNDEKLKKIKHKLDELSIPFSDNPALQAFLKIERTAAGLGED